MSYTIKQLADLAGISVRTLHFYDQSGLLQPDRRQNNGYRQYEEKELLRLQQILFFRELDFPICEIKKIISAPNFDIRAALHEQKKLIKVKRQRLDNLIKTIDQTIKKVNKELIMTDQDLYNSFSNEETDKLAEEAKQRWGHTEAYKTSAERVKKMSKADMARIQAEGKALLKNIADNISKGAQSAEIQKLIGQHFNNLRHFYEPTLEMYRGLANMYVADARFFAYYEKFAPGLAQFLREAMIFYCEEHGEKL